MISLYGKVPDKMQYLSVTVPSQPRHQRFLHIGPIRCNHSVVVPGTSFFAEVSVNISVLKYFVQVSSNILSIPWKQLVMSSLELKRRAMYFFLRVYVLSPMQLRAPVESHILEPLTEGQHLNKLNNAHSASSNDREAPASDKQEDRRTTLFIRGI